MSTLLPAPVDLGAPPRFQHWRHYQDTAIFDAADTPERFIMQVVPTGAGKSLIYMMLGKLLGVRTAVLTRTKALQAQLTSDFHSMGLKTIQGMNAYLCKALEPGGELYGVFTELAKKGNVGCDEGPCRVGTGCSLKSGGCHYYDAVKAATESDMLVTNYTYWMHQNKHGKGLGDVGLLILDEAHDAAEALSEFLTVHLEPWQLARINAQPLQGTPTPDDWRQWAAYHYQKANLRAEQLAAEIKQARESDRSIKRAAMDEARFLKTLATTLDTIRGVTEDWVCFYDTQTPAKPKWTFTPAWPAPYAEKALFLGIPKVVLTSATVREKTAVYLGIPSSALKVIEYPSTFAKQRRPVIHIQTTKVSHKMSDQDTKLWLARIDQLLKARTDRKGIIHSVSYARSRFIYQYSDYRDKMIVHSSEGTRAAIARFKSAGPGAILVSPSVTTGYDFPYQECEYQIVTKIPFPDSRDPVLSARTLRDPEYGMYLAMQTLVQMAGRGMRAADDQCECVAPGTLILKDDLTWVPAGELQEGQRLLTFDEQGNGRGHGRRWRWGHVVKARTSKMRRVRLVLSDGEVVCTPNHPWITRATGPGVSGTHQWKHTEELNAGDTLVRLFQPDDWNIEYPYELGWLSGFFDGEGCLTLRQGSRNPNVTALSGSQLEGAVFDRALEFMTTCGFQHSARNVRGRQWQVHTKGGFAEIARVLGVTGPVRLLEKFLKHDRAEKLQALSYPKVVRVERIADGPITSLQTTTKTYVAAGLAAHNTLIIDDQIRWFAYKYRALAPKWFLDTLKTVGLIPDPPAKLQIRKGAAE